MNRICIRAPEYLGCYILLYEVETDQKEMRLEGGLFKASESGKTELRQKHIYRPLA